MSSQLCTGERGVSRIFGEDCSYLLDKFLTRAIIHDRPTRYRGRLDIPSCRINAGQRAFYYHDVKILNNFSKDLREFINTKVFKETSNQLIN